jgi:CubicO group peptidase (beta-lactamase class C family)
MSGDLFSAAWRETTQEMLAERIATGPLGGAIASLWTHDRPAIEFATGEQSPGVPMPMDAIFQIASMTKPIVSVAALQLVDEGAIALDDPIDAWLPEFAQLRVMRDPAGRLDDTSPAREPIRVDHLLTHRAGWGYAFLEDGPIARAYDDTIGSVLTTSDGVDEWLAALARLPLMDEPGTRFRYGHATDVLGSLIARIDGESLGKSLRRRVLEPLGMHDTSFAVPLSKRARLAGLDAPPPPVSPPRFEAGGGGLYSTAPDYMRFARMMLGRGEVDGVRLLRPATADLMMSNQLPDEQRALPAIGRPDFFRYTGFGYGLGVVVEREGAVTPTPGSVTWRGIFGTWWRADPANGFAAVLMTQEPADISSHAVHRDPDQLTAAGELQLAFETAIYHDIDRNGSDA